VALLAVLLRFLHLILRRLGFKRLSENRTFAYKFYVFCKKSIKIYIGAYTNSNAYCDSFVEPNSAIRTNTNSNGNSTVINAYAGSDPGFYAIAIRTTVCVHSCSVNSCFW
jgi:hypothetical protein